jgi:hypothetical protein
MIMLYGEAGGNAAGAKRLYEERFPGRCIPDARTFTRTVQRLRESGNFKMNTRDIGSSESDRRLDAEEEVLERVEARSKSKVLTYFYFIITCSNNVGVNFVYS